MTGPCARRSVISPRCFNLERPGRKDIPVKGDPNRDTAALKKINDHTIEIVNKKGGKVMTTNRMVFSKDGKSRTATTTGTNAQGQKVNNSVVSEK